MEVESKPVMVEGKEYLFRPNFRCFIEYEKLTGKSIDNIETLSDSATFLYCGILAGMKFAKKEFKFSLDEFIDMLDDIDILSTLGDGEEKPKVKKK